MLWARVIRGMKSIAKPITLWSAACWTPTGHTSGSAMPAMICSGRKRSMSSRPFSGFMPQVRTCTTTSAPKTSSREPVCAPCAS
jgi:hypothetical protein